MNTVLSFIFKVQRGFKTDHDFNPPSSFPFVHNTDDGSSTIFLFPSLSLQHSVDTVMAFFEDLEESRIESDMTGITTYFEHQYLDLSFIINDNSNPRIV